jgi:hypothetical protein
MELIDSILHSIDATIVIDPLCKVISQGNLRNQLPLFSKLENIIPKICEVKPSLILRSIIPMYIELLNTAKGDVQSANEKVLRLIKKELGRDAFLDLICSLPLAKQNIIRSVI